MEILNIKSQFEPALRKISKEFTWDTFQNILGKININHDCNLKSFNVDGNSKKGDSYISIIYKINIVLDVFIEGNESIEKHVSLFVKALPKSIGRRKTFRSTDFFQNEVAFYNKILPELKKFQLEKNVSSLYDEIPQCYAAFADGVNDFIVLENINILGYQSLDRQNCLNYEHCLKTMHAFARFHSMSLAYKDQYPEKYSTLIENNLKETYFTEQLRSSYQKFYKKLSEFWMDIISIELPDTVYESKFKHLLDTDFHGTLIQIANKKDPLNVVSHGDAWLPNFLFKYGMNNTPESIKLIDFQLARSSSPALDLSFFLYSCTNNDLRIQYWDDLLKEYHRIFTSCLIELGSNPNLYTYESLEADLRENAKFGLGMALEAVPVSMMSDTEAPDLDNIAGDQSYDLSLVYTLHPITEPENRKRMVDVVKHAVDNGFI